MTITIVDSPSALHTLRTQLASEKIIALDTEFHSENRYFPELMLMQIANLDGDVWIVDPKKINPEPLGAALRNTTIITHGGREDVRILYRELGLTPKRFFDTQIGAGLLGYRFPMGLGDLAPLIIGKDVSKGETLTDWSFRPLKTKQIEYAAQDALILLPLYTELLRRLQEEGKEELCWLASDDLVLESLKTRDVRTDWCNWGLAEILSLKSQRVITGILEWREDLAERKNKPANYLLPKASLIYLAKQHPTHIGQIQNRKINRIFLKKYGSDVIKTIRTSLQSTEIFSIPSNTDKERIDFLNIWVKIFAKKLSIAPKLLLPPSLISSIVLEGISALQGWRKELCLEALERVLEGSETIVVQNGSLTLIELPKAPVSE